MKSMANPLLLCAFIFFSGCTACSSSNLTVHEITGQVFLEHCPETPNCVSSIEPEENKHYIPPLRYTGKKELAYRKLEAIIESDSRFRIVTKQANYLKAEFRSAIFGFVDDVEFLFASDLSTINVRSASRIGYFDFGANRRRIEYIRKRWDKN